MAARSYSSVVGGFFHSLAQRSDQVGLAAFQKKFHVAHGFLVHLRRSQAFDTRPQAAPDVVLQARARVVASEIHLARGNQEVPVDQVDDAIGKVGREVRTVVGVPVLAEPAGYVDPRVAFAEREFDVGVGLVVAQQDVEARLALLDEVIFKREGFLVVGDDDVVDVDRLAHERPGFGVGPAAFMEIGRYAAAKIFGLPDVDHLALGVLVEVHAGLGRDGADFLEEIHGRLLF